MITVEVDFPDDSVTSTSEDIYQLMMVFGGDIRFKDQVTGQLMMANDDVCLLGFVMHFGRVLLAVIRGQKESGFNDFYGEFEMSFRRKDNGMIEVKRDGMTEESIEISEDELIKLYGRMSEKVIESISHGIPEMLNNSGVVRIVDEYRRMSADMRTK